MSDVEKLSAFRAQLLDEQRKLVMEAASAGMIPAAGLVRRIAALEQVILAVDSIMEEQIS